MFSLAHTLHRKSSREQFCCRLYLADADLLQKRVKSCKWGKKRSNIRVENDSQKSGCAERWEEFLFLTVSLIPIMNQMCKDPEPCEPIPHLTADQLQASIIRSMFQVFFRVDVVSPPGCRRCCGDTSVTGGPAHTLEMSPVFNLRLGAPAGLLHVLLLLCSSSSWYMFLNVYTLSYFINLFAWHRNHLNHKHYTNATAV